MRSKRQQYTAADIEVLKGLDPVRKRPGMYTDTANPNHLVYEVVDNSVDEALNGKASYIRVSLHDDDGVTVRDDGRGMPVDVHPGERMSGVELILTRLHAGAKFSNRQYRYSGGLHGVGVSVVNALSAQLQVQVYRDGCVYSMRFRQGRAETALQKQPLSSSARSARGTEIHFVPDPQYFDVLTVDVQQLCHILRAKAVLCPGLRIELQDERHEKSWQWHYREGLDAYLLDAMQSRELLPERPLHGSWKGTDGEVEWSLAWLASGGEPLMESYVNLVPTAQGGTHLNGLRKGLVDALREFCAHRSLLPRGMQLKPEDFWWNCSCVLSVRMVSPQFTGQAKERLSARSAMNLVYAPVREQLLHWLHRYPGQGERLAAMAISHAQHRRREENQLGLRPAGTGLALPGKLMDCTSCDLGRNELFLVEGDSAGGSARQARDRKFQAVLPLRGKIINTWELDAAMLSASKEVRNIAVAVGVTPGSTDLSRLRYGKICILADADSDGAHISALLCALFLRHFSVLVAGGHVHVAMPPLYRIDAGKQVHYALDDQELEGIVAGLGSYQVMRFKGLGEMSPMQLRETTLLPGRRKLIRLELGDQGESWERMDMLLARRRTQDRRRWLESKGNLAIGENPYATAALARKEEP